MSSYQKPHCERNHEFMRKVIPKGTSMSFMNQEKTSLMMNNINNYSRKSLGDNTPYAIFKFIYGIELLKKTGCKNTLPPMTFYLNPA